MKRLIIIIIIIIGFAIWLSLAESILFDYYEESIADRWANILSIPFLIFLLIMLFRDRLKSFQKDGKQRLIQTFKYAAGGVFGIWLFYYFIFMPAISGTILLINAYIGNQQQIEITGIVTKKTAYSMQRSSNYELAIRLEKGELKLESNGVLVKKYVIGSSFNDTLEKGSLGLLFKRKPNY